MGQADTGADGGALRSENPAFDRYALADLIGSNVLDQISRVPGVGSTRLFGSEYAMNIWLNPEKLQGYGLSASQALAAVRGQNVQFAAGSVGAQPAPAGQAFTATVTAEGRFSTPEQFGNIVLRANSDGTTVRCATWRGSRMARSRIRRPQWSGSLPRCGHPPGSNALAWRRRCASAGECRTSRSVSWVSPRQLDVVRWRSRSGGELFCDAWGSWLF